MNDALPLYDCLLCGRHVAKSESHYFPMDPRLPVWSLYDEPVTRLCAKCYATATAYRKKAKK